METVSQQVAAWSSQYSWALIAITAIAAGSDLFSAVFRYLTRSREMDMVEKSSQRLYDLATIALGREPKNGGT